MIKKYFWVLLFNILSAAILFVPTGLYIYVKFGFWSEVVHVTTKRSVIGIFFIAAAGLYLLGAVKKRLRGIKNWKMRYVLLTAYYILIAAACVYLINKLCDTVDVLAASALKSITDLTKAITYTSMLFFICFLMSRVASFFAALFKSKIDDRETLKAAQRAQKELDKVKARSEKKKKKKEIYFHD